MGCCARSCAKTGRRQSANRHDARSHGLPSPLFSRKLPKLVVAGTSGMCQKATSNRYSITSSAWRGDCEFKGRGSDTRRRPILFQSPIVKTSRGWLPPFSRPLPKRYSTSPSRLGANPQTGMPPRFAGNGMETSRKSGKAKPAVKNLTNIVKSAGTH
jgi:hypothetical protein